MGRLQIHSPSSSQNDPLFSRSLEDLLLDAANNFSEESDDDNPNINKSRLSREESKVEREIIRIILSGKTDSLNPNSGQAVTICEHHVCIGFHEEKEHDYRVWEWHGHIMLFDEENGYSPEYIYGNYFERLPGKVNYGGGITEAEENEEEETKEVLNMGLRGLIDGGNSKGSASILHRNIDGFSPRLS
uniref:Uncharacterized protein n=1 Tax=Rhizophora mucronata TaxID=61149 RepID=A0A2P2Q656_RHIMU